MSAVATLLACSRVRAAAMARRSGTDAMLGDTDGWSGAKV